MLDQLQYSCVRFGEQRYICVEYIKILDAFIFTCTLIKRLSQHAQLMLSQLSRIWVLMLLLITNLQMQSLN